MKFLQKILFGFSLFYSIYALEPFEEKKIGKTYSISKFNDQKIEIDGFMIDSVWDSIPVLTSFTQDSPLNGADPSYQTSIKLFYDENAVYIFARMYDDEPSKIQKRFSKIDDWDNAFEQLSDWMWFSFDSRHDHQTGYIFAVNCSGVKVDASIYDDLDYDINYNSIWYADTKIDEFGWTAEIRIPFESLQFDTNINDIWGFNATRYIYRLNEYSSWVSFPLEVKGESSKFGHVKGFKNILNIKKFVYRPSVGYDYQKIKNTKLRLDSDGYIIDKDLKDLLPSKIQKNHQGFDVKYRISNSSTIDFSYKPDFGQVEVDPSDINISYYETYLEEKRPFFMENSTMFDLPIEMFYSRRIGASKNLNNYNLNIPTNIDIAFKMTGKEQNGFSYGFISAVTSNEVDDLEIVDYNVTDNQYNVFRIKQDLLDGNSFLGFMYTKYRGMRGFFEKNSNQYGPIDGEIFDVSAYSIDGVFNLLENRFYTDFQFASTQLQNRGYAYSLESFYDINNSWSTFFEIEKIDKYFDSDDIGYIYRNDIITKKIGLKYQNLRPNSIFQDRVFRLGYVLQKNDSKDNKINENFSIGGVFGMINNTTISVGLKKSYDSFDDRLLYDYKQSVLIGKNMFVPSSYDMYLGWSSDQRKKNAYSILFDYYKNKIKDRSHKFSLQYVNRPLNNIKLTFNYNFNKSKKLYEYLESIDYNGVMRDVFANSKNNIQKYIMRIDAYINKNFTLQTYTELIKTNNRYSNYMELDNDVFPKITSFSSGLYASENNNPVGNQYPNPNNDGFFLSNYSELIYNFVLKYEINPISNFYFIYTRYWMVNGKKFDSFGDFINYSLQSEDSWVEKNFDHGFSVKYTYQF
ncbi:MAG: hypothetical protein CMG00_02070 [Candidatus Marinimicrobia bacterium]|nr:hypothetical protein [Candidatus Neomarinimicrobiota bacterium]